MEDTPKTGTETFSERGVDPDDGPAGQDTGSESGAEQDSECPSVTVEDLASPRQTRGALNEPPDHTAVSNGTGRGVVFAYLRHSFEDRTSRSILSQEETINAYIKECMIPNDTAPFGVRKYFIDTKVGGSRSISHRPGLKDLFDQLAAHSEDRPHLVTYDLSRLAKNARAGTEIRDALIQHGVTLHLAKSRTVLGGKIALAKAFADPIEHRPRTPPRARDLYKCQPEWDPRKSYGWYFPGAGKAPVEVPDEQAALRLMKGLYEGGFRVANIAKELQSQFGNKRHRKFTSPPSLDSGGSPWTGHEVAFLAKKHKWVWGVRPPDHAPPQETFGRSDLEAAARNAIAGGQTLERFLKTNKGKYYDGVKINRAMLRHYFTTEMPKWRQEAFEICRQRMRSKGCSTDVIRDLLNERVQRPDGKPWSRQTAWRLLKEAQSADAQSTAHSARTESGNGA